MTNGANIYLLKIESQIWIYLEIMFSCKIIKSSIVIKKVIGSHLKKLSVFSALNFISILTYGEHLLLIVFLIF